MSSEASKTNVPDILILAVDRTESRMEEQRLFQLLKLASLGEMATGIAHEVNQPLSVIQLGVRILRRDLTIQVSREKLEHSLDRIVEQTRRINRLVTDMRIFGRKPMEQAEDYQLDAAIDSAVRLMCPLLRLNQVELSVTRNTEGAVLHGWQDQLEQVIMNLIQNASDAIVSRRETGGLTAPGVVHIHSWLETRNNETTALIRTCDNGGDIAPDVMDRLFETFFTTKPPGKGTGLGLSISFGILRENGGTISADNVGEGACFTVRVPLAGRARNQRNDAAKGTEFLVSKRLVS